MSDAAPHVPDHAGAPAPAPEPEPFGQTGVRQFILPALATISMVVMILSLGMWWRSHHVVDTFTSEKRAASWYISSIYGRMLVACNFRPQPFDDLDGNWSYTSSPLPTNIRDGWQSSVWKSLGIEWRPEPLRLAPGGRGWWLRVRWPFVAAVASILPIVRAIYVMRQRRRLARASKHACPECGYDLRFSPNYCPECGRPIARGKP